MIAVTDLDREVMGAGSELHVDTRRAIAEMNPGLGGGDDLTRR